MEHLNHVPLKPLLGKPAVPPCRGNHWGIGRHLAFEDVVGRGGRNVVRIADPTVLMI